MVAITLKLSTQGNGGYSSICAKGKGYHSKSVNVGGEGINEAAAWKAAYRNMYVVTNAWKEDGFHGRVFVKHLSTCIDNVLDSEPNRTCKVIDL